MTTSSPKSMQDLHRIREQISRDYQGLSAHAFVERLHREVEIFVKKHKIMLKRVSPPSQTVTLEHRDMS